MNSESNLQEKRSNNFNEQNLRVFLRLFTFAPADSKTIDESAEHFESLCVRSIDIEQRLQGKRCCTEVSSKLNINSFVQSFILDLFEFYFIFTHKSIRVQDNQSVSTNRIIDGNETFRRQRLTDLSYLKTKSIFIKLFIHPLFSRSDSNSDKIEKSLHETVRKEAMMKHHQLTLLAPMRKNLKNQDDTNKHYSKQHSCNRQENFHKPKRENE